MSQQLRIAGRLWLLFAAFLFAQGAWAQLLTDDFSAATLPYSLTAPGGGWAAHSGGGTNSVMATTPTLTYAGLATAGGSVALTTSGEDVNRQFAQQTSGAVYASFLVNFTSAQAAGDYFLHLGPATLGTTFISRVFAKSATGGFQLGVSKGTDAAGPVYSNTVYALNTTYFVVLKYTFVAGGTTNDLVDLFIQPAIGQPEPTPSVSTTSVIADLANAGTIALRQGTTSSAPGVRVDYIRVGTSWADVTSGTMPTAALSVNPTTLTGFAATQGTVSNVQAYTVSGSNLDGTPVSVSATANIELSTTAGGTFTPTLSLPASASSISQTIYVRLTSVAPMGAFSGTITNTANGTLTAAVTVSGQVNAVNAPALSASPTTLSSFSTSQGTVSAEKTYTLTAANLTGPIAVSAPAGVEISQISGSGFSSSLTLPVSTTSAVVYVHLTGSGAAGNVSGTITNIAGSLTANVAVSGTVSSTAPVGPYTPIATARAGINSTFTVAGRVTVSTQLGARQIYIQDATGGIAVYSGPAPAPDFTTLVNIGDSVQVRGPVTVFSGYLELTGTGNFTVVAGAGSRVPTPIAITPDQLANYQGQLVSVANATITPVAGSFSGGTNYTITAGGASGILRISANSPLSGAGQPANPVSVTGIADRFVSGATTVGTDALQLQPRILADIPGSTPATDLTCTIGSSSTLTLDKTLDIAAWNFEFFGADAGVISCPDGKTLAYANFGPTNEALQQSNATTVLSKLNADIISAEEISDINRFDAAVKAMPGSYSYICSNRFSYYFQDECDQVPSGNPPVVFGPTRLAQKVCVIYNTATVTPVLAETKPLLDGKYSYPSSSGWASGRLPFLFVANVTINGLTQKIHVVALHAKSGSATADYNRRKQDIIDLKAELDANYANANIVILGDYNDKLNGSIAAGQPSSYQPFVTDAVNYSAITLPLENQGCSTFNSSASFIDHFIVSNELAKAYVSNSAYVLQPFSIPNYGNTTSDHNPIVSRYDLSQFVSPVTALSLTLTANPTTLLTTGTTTLSATVAGGTAPYSYSFSGPGSITASGNTASVSSLTAGVQTFTVVAKDVTAPTSQTISATVSVTVTAPVVVTPVVTVTPSALTGFQYTTQSDGSAAQSYTVSATNLPTSLTVTAPANYLVSLDNNTFSPTAVVAATNGSITPTRVYVALFAHTAGTFNGTIMNVSGSATATVAVSGTVLQATLTVIPTALSNFTTTVGTPSAVQTYTITTLNQSGITAIAPAGVQIRTGSNPFSSSLTIGTSYSTISVPVDVRLSGTATGPITGTIVHLPANGDNRLPAATVAINGSVNPVQPTGPAMLTITSFNCVSANGGLSSVNFTVGYSDGTFAPALPPLFINGVTASGQLGQSYSFGFDSNVNTLPIADNASRSVYFVWNFRQACAGPVTPPAPTPPVAPVLTSQMATQGTFFSYVVPAFTGTAPITYSATGLPASLNFNPASRTISGTPSTTGVSTVVISASNTAGQSSGQFTLTVSASATQPTGPAMLTITSFNCVSANGGLSSVNFTVGYSDGTFAPALPPLFINGVTASGQLGQSYSFGFDSNVNTLPIADNASRSVYFVWNFRQACAGPVTPPAPTPPVAPVLTSQMATQGTFFSYVVPAFTGTAPITYTATGLPANLNFNPASRTISGTPSTTGVSTVVISASNTAGQSSGQFTLTVSASATQPTGPAMLTITSFNCVSANGGLSSVNFTVGYSDGTFAPALPPLFINGVTASGQLGQSYSFGFDSNVNTLPIADNASRSVYFVWNFRQACATKASSGRLSAELVAPLHLSVLGNPVRHTVEVEVTGAAGGSLNLLLTDAQGRTLGQRQIEQAGSTEKIQFNVNSQPTGILLLRAVTPTQVQTLRVLKAD